MNATKDWYTVRVEDYLAGEKDAAVRHEYVYGEVFAMAGGSNIHNTVTLNLVTALNPAARQKGCRTYSSDLKVRASEKIFYYPDVMFVCEEGPDAYYVDKPCVIVEVISPSTARTDVNEKRYAYQALPTLQLYLLVDSRKQFVLGYYRTKKGWEERHFDEGETVPIPCADLSLTFEDIYIQTPYL